MIILTLMMNFFKISQLNRRTFLGAFASFSALSIPSYAMDAGEAEELVTKVVGEINKVIASGKSDSAIMVDFEKLFDKYADVNTIARYALGRDARKASASELKEFTKIFKRYISHKYGSRFREFIGGKIEVKSSRKVKKFYEVKTNAVVQNQGSFEVIFLVSDRSGQKLFFNIFVEGINLLLTERSEIGSMLDRNNGDINAMILDLKKSVG